MEKTINYKGYQIEIKQDTHASNPNEMGDTGLGFLVYDHDQFCIKVEGCDPDDVFEAYSQGKSMFSFQSHYRDKPEDYKIYPVYAYIHSGVSLSLGRDKYPFNCRWDTSFKGFLLINTVEYDDPAKHYKIAEEYIQEWNDYCSGNVWGYDIEDGDLSDSCWGYTGDVEYCIGEAKAVVDGHLRRKVKDHLKQVKTWVKNRVPYKYRFANKYL